MLAISHHRARVVAGDNEVCRDSLSPEHVPRRPGLDRPFRSKVNDETPLGLCLPLQRLPQRPADEV